jgi:hypothetical protein
VFITGEMIPVIRGDKCLVKMLSSHEIGYHSSVHSRRPTILEYTDLRDYEEAVRVSMKREGDHSGLPALRETFPESDVIAFRAPRLSWSPPHLVALHRLGVRFDFSTNISDISFAHRGIVFFPSPIYVDNIWRVTTFARALIHILAHDTVVLGIHPSKVFYKGAWDWKFMHPRVCFLHRQKACSSFEVAIRLVALQLLFLVLRALREIGLARVTPKMNTPTKPLHPNIRSMEEIHQASIDQTLRCLRYQPEHWLDHLRIFLEPA